MALKITNLVLFNAAWFACILGAGGGRPWLGPVVVALSVGVHLVLMRDRVALVILYVLTFGIGWVADLVVVLAGGLGFPDHASLGRPVPIWMPFMWVNFATTLHLSLSWMRGRYLVAFLLGGVGGPSSYFTGMKLGAVLLPDPVLGSLAIIAAEWALSMVLLIWLAERLGPVRPVASAGPAKTKEVAS